jgi:hypothetical protein
MAAKIVFFPHSDDEFKDQQELRHWLKYDLKEFRNGFYSVRNANGLGELEKGSLVFFNKGKYCVGFAVVGEGLRNITEEEKDKFGEDYKKCIKFLPESICVFNDDQLIKLENITNIINKNFRRGYTTVDNPEDLLKIFKLIGQSKKEN